jgi:hypothetical protein
MSLAKDVEFAKDFGIWLHEKTNEKLFPNPEQEMVGMALLQNVLDINDAIIILIETKLHGPALALARPLYENFLRGFWLWNCATKIEIDAFLDGELNGERWKMPKIPVLINKVKETNVEAATWFDTVYTNNKKLFDGFTHGGSEHVIRRCNGHIVEPNYSEEELRVLIRLGVDIRYRTGRELFLRMNVGSNELDERLRQFNQLSALN